VEAIQSSRGGWQVGVQFHPEDMPEHQSLFDRFVEAAR
jgi:gamma-glutamyl-gamma-aminobutyrate hydrolase PuuD